MHKGEFDTSSGSVEIISRAGLPRFPHWKATFAARRKDYRFYELIEDTLHQEFEYRYFVIKDREGSVRAIAPFFILQQDILLGVSPLIGDLLKSVRRLWPRCMLLRTLMVGCVAGEGHLEGADEAARSANARILAENIRQQAHDLRASLIVLKEFPAHYRAALECFRAQGFTRIPSLPMVRLGIEYASFADYAAKALNSSARAKLRKKLNAAASSRPITLTVLNDISAAVAEAYPLYLQVYERSPLHFERLTEAYFSELGRVLPDKVRFFVWRQDGRMVAFCVCMIEGDALFAEYLGLDYSVALELHLYHYAFRDMVSWAIANGFKSFHSSGLNYDPKLHLRFRLEPIDLYVRHTSGVLNAGLRFILPWLEPTRYDKVLSKFPNYHELWDDSRGEAA